MSIFINTYICNTCQYLYFCRKFAEMDKGKRKAKRYLEFTSSTDNKSCKNIFNVKPYDIQQPVRYFKLFSNWYINILLIDFWEKVNCVQQLQNEHMWSGTPVKVLTYVTHMENSQINLNSVLPVFKFEL